MSFLNIIYGQKLLDQQIRVMMVGSIMMMMMMMIRYTGLVCGVVTRAPYPKYGQTLLKNTLTLFDFLRVSVFR